VCVYLHSNFCGGLQKTHVDVGIPRREDPKLIICVITFELTQLLWPRYHNVTDRQTDRWMDGRYAHSTSRSKNWNDANVKLILPVPYLTDCVIYSTTQLANFWLCPVECTSCHWQFPFSIFHSIHASHTWHLTGCWSTLVLHIRIDVNETKISRSRSRPGYSSPRPEIETKNKIKTKNKVLWDQDRTDNANH